MNLKTFIVGLFTSRVSNNLNGQLDSIRESARQDAALVADAYLDSFESSLADRLKARQRKLIGFDSQDIKVIPDVESTARGKRRR